MGYAVVGPHMEKWEYNAIVAYLKEESITAVPLWVWTSSSYVVSQQGQRKPVREAKKYFKRCAAKFTLVGKSECVCVCVSLFACSKCIEELSVMVFWGILFCLLFVLCFLSCYAAGGQLMRDKKIVLRKSQLDTAWTSFHCNNGHPGARVVEAHLRQTYYCDSGTGLRTWLEAKIKGCKHCQQKRGPPLRKAPPVAIESSRPYQRIVIDHTAVGATDVQTGAT